MVLPIPLSRIFLPQAIATQVYVHVSAINPLVMAMAPAESWEIELSDWALLPSGTFN